MLIYVHGFLSSPKSVKARQTAEYMAQNFPDFPVLTPQLPANPIKAMALLEDLIIKNQKLIKGLLGSSLGGFYATYLADKYSVKSVLINPAVRPYKLFSDYLGLQTNPYTNEQFVVDDAYLQALEAFDVPSVSQQSLYWLLQQQGDEVLDYRDAVSHYQGCKQTVEAQGSHGFDGFERFLPSIAEFFDLT